MENRQSPPWLQELLDDTEAADQKHQLEMNKLRADQALAAIAVIEEKIAETEQIAQQETDLITNWKESETAKLQNKINWLTFNLEKFIRGTGDATIALAHGTIKIRKSRDKIDIVDLQKFSAVGQRHGLLRHIDAKDEPDMNAIRAFIKLNGGKPCAGVILTPGQPTFSYKTNKKGSTNGESERNETEAGYSGTQQTAKVQAAA
jgi:phage host-nuclease inhibitor protein Gam